MPAKTTYKQLENEIARLKQRERDLLEEKKNLHIATSTAMDSIFIKDKKRRYTFVNTAMTRLFGCEQEDLLGKRPEDVFSPEEAATVKKVDDLNFQGEDVSEVRELTINGTRFYFHTIQNPIRDSRGRIVGISGIVRDVTEFKRQELALRRSDRELTEARDKLEIRVEQRTAELKQSEQRFRDLIQSAPVGIAELDAATGRILTTNTLFSEFTEFSPKELKQMTSTELFVGTGQKRFEEEFSSLAKGELSGLTNEYQFVTKTGKVKWGETHTNLVWENDQAVRARIIILDITARKQAEFEVSKKKIELEMNARELEEKNKALKELSKQSEASSHQLVRRILGNVEELVSPYVEHLKQTELDPDQRLYLNVVEANLSELLEPFARRIGNTFKNLSPREVEVAHLVRMGKSSREIAQLLGITTRAVEFHRDKLRDKLGLKNKKQNLRAYLASFM